MRIEFIIDAGRVQAALRRAPLALRKHLRRGIGRVTQEFARTAKQNAPKALSTMANSIIGTQPSDYEGLIRAPVNYAGYTEHGTDHQPMPPTEPIEVWIRAKGIQPHDPRDSRADLAFKIARSIALHGVPSQPFMRKTLAERREQADGRMRAAVAAALAEVAA